MKKEELKEMVSLVSTDTHYGDSEQDTIRIVGELAKVMGQSMYSKEEYCLAGLTATLLAISKRYNIVFDKLVIDESRNKNFSLLALVSSAIRMMMSSYTFHKRLLVVIGMVCTYCVYRKIDLKKYFFQYIGVK